MSKNKVKKAIQVFKKIAKKKPAKKAAKKKKIATKNKTVVKKKLPSKKPPVKKDPKNLFYDWYSKVASKKVDKIEKDWIKENEANDPNDDGGGDHWHVNQMMFNGDAHEMTAENAEPVFIKGYNGEPWTMEQSDSLYCELDVVIQMAYEAGKKARNG